MSTKCSAAYGQNERAVGEDAFTRSIHAYTECFGEDVTLYFDLWEQGVFENHEATFALQGEVALRFAEDMGKWAARIRRGLANAKQSEPSEKRL